jgi:hypothetical protein
MLFVVLGRAKDASDPLDRNTRRLEWQYPEGSNVIGEYWLQHSDPRLVSIVETDDVGQLFAATTEWEDHFAFTIVPAVTAEQGLEMIRARMEEAGGIA